MAGAVMEESGASEILPATMSPFHPVAVVRRVAENSAGLIGLIIVVILVLIAAFAPLIAPEDPYTPVRTRMNEPPRWANLGTYNATAQARRTGLRPNTVLGRDVRGRDVLSRVIYGARSSLLIGVSVVLLAGAIGITLGALAGYIGGAFDATVMRIVDILLAFPFLVLALAAVSIFPHATSWHIAAVLGFTFWPAICRLTRGQVLATRGSEYISAVRSLGAGHARILLRHILPNCIAPVIIWFAMGIAGAIMGEASLSFLGLGDPDTTSWGAMIYSGLSRSNFPDEWWSAMFPAAALAATVLGFNLLGDALQDALNPRATQ